MTTFRPFDEKGNMVFSSHIFLFYFLPLALAAYFLAGKKWRNAILTLSSYIFYGWGEPMFVLLLLLLYHLPHRLPRFLMFSR